MPTLNRLGLVSRSTDDAIVRPSLPESINEQTLHAALSRPEGAWHTTYCEAAERFNAEIASFARFAANMKLTRVMAKPRQARRHFECPRPRRIRTSVAAVYADTPQALAPSRAAIWSWLSSLPTGPIAAVVSAPSSIRRDTARSAASSTASIFSVSSVTSSGRP
jgi:hypothetical protein